MIFSIAMVLTGCFRQASDDDAPLAVPAVNDSTGVETDVPTDVPSDTPALTETAEITAEDSTAVAVEPTATETEVVIEPSATATEPAVTQPVPTQTETATMPMATVISPEQMQTLTAPTAAIPLGTPIAAENGFQPVSDNADWQPQMRVIQGVEMVLVPAGCFMMGDDDVTEEAPAHEQCFERPFWIDRYEVTNALFGSVGMTTHPGKPRDMVSWFGAVQHCQSRAARLPTEAEWEYAARGPSSLTYPWGNAFDGDNVVYSGKGDGAVQIVGSVPAGASWVGAFDMSGNVWEWTSTNFNEYPYVADGSLDRITFDDTWRVIRGGSAINLEDPMRSSARSAPETTHASPYVGFRCAKDFAFP